MAVLGPLSFAMGQVHHRPEPTTEDPFLPPRPPKPPRSLWPHEQREQQIERYCLRQARLEVEAMFTGRAYRWVPFDERTDRGSLADAVPLDFFVEVK
jgi:hypothetical protein